MVFRSRCITMESIQDLCWPKIVGYEMSLFRSISLEVGVFFFSDFSTAKLPFFFLAPKELPSLPGRIAHPCHKWPWPAQGDGQ